MLSVDFYKSPSKLVGITVKARYQIIRLFIEDPVGLIYKALDLKLQKMFLLYFPPREVVEDPDRLKLLEESIDRSVSLMHKNILYVYGLEKQDNIVFAVMENIEGNSVYELVEARGPLDVEEATQIAISVCNALKYGHSRGLRHGDIRPKTVFLSRAAVKVFGYDFGLLVKGILREERRDDFESSVAPFSPPEELAKSQVDFRGDIFSLGALYYFMLSGEPPDYTNKGTHRIKELDRVPPWAEHIVRKCMRSDPKGRYQNVAFLCKAFERGLELLDEEKIRIRNIRLKQAADLENEKKFDEALAIYREIFSLFPNDPEALDGIRRVEIAAKLQKAEKLVQEGKTEEARRLYLEVMRKDPLNDDAIAALRRLNGMEARRAEPSLFDYIPKLIDKPVILKKGIYNINFDVVILKEGTLEIQAGTVINFSEGKGIISYGKLVINGTETEPVEIKSTKPSGWANIILLGEQASGSSLKSCILNLGRGRKIDFIPGETPKIQLEGQDVKQGQVYGGVLAIINTNRILIQNCRFFDSKADMGGAIFVKSGTVRLQHVTIESNVAKVGGGLCAVEGSDVQVTHCNISSNVCQQQGGGVFCDKVRLSIVSSTLRDNSAASDGGGVCSMDSILRIRDTDIRSNVAKTFGGGVYSSSDQKGEITRCFFEGNEALIGGGIYLNRSEILIKNNEFINNSAQQGGAIYVSEYTQAIVNNRFEGNTPDNVRGSKKRRI